MESIRKPVVSGSFYPAEPNELTALLKKFTRPNIPKQKAIGVVCPHAGYIYSGGVAGAVLSAVELPENIIILAPNHSGLGELFSLAPHTKWQTPLGSVSINQELNALLKSHCPMIDAEPEAHAQEHAAEVIVPFLQYLKPDIKVSVVVIADDGPDDIKLFGTGLANAIETFDKPVLVVASSDMTHYESAETARQKDRMALDKILALDETGLYLAVRKHNITMCGYAPVMALLVAAKALGAQNGRLVKYTHSGEVSSDTNEVVGYAGIVISAP